MATFYDRDVIKKEPIEVESSQDKRWTPQKVKFINKDNIFYGTMIGKIKGDGVELNHAKLSNTIIYGEDGLSIDLNQIGKYESRVCALEQEIPIINSNIKTLSDDLALEISTRMSSNYDVLTKAYEYSNKLCSYTDRKINNEVKILTQKIDKEKHYSILSAISWTNPIEIKDFSVNTIIDNFPNAKVCYEENQEIGKIGKVFRDEDENISSLQFITYDEAVNHTLENNLKFPKTYILSIGQEFESERGKGKLNLIQINEGKELSNYEIILSSERLIARDIIYEGEVIGRILDESEDGLSGKLELYPSSESSLSNFHNWDQYFSIDDYIKTEYKGDYKRTVELRMSETPKNILITDWFYIEKIINLSDDTKGIFGYIKSKDKDGNPFEKENFEVTIEGLSVEALNNDYRLLSSNDFYTTINKNYHLEFNKTTDNNGNIKILNNHIYFKYGNYGEEKDNSLSGYVVPKLENENISVGGFNVLSIVTQGISALPHFTTYDGQRFELNLISGGLFENTFENDLGDILFISADINSNIVNSKIIYSSGHELLQKLTFNNNVYSIYEDDTHYDTLYKSQNINLDDPEFKDINNGTTLQLSVEEKTEITEEYKSLSIYVSDLNEMKFKFPVSNYEDIAQEFITVLSIGGSQEFVKIVPTDDDIKFVNGNHTDLYIETGDEPSYLFFHEVEYKKYFVEDMADNEAAIHIKHLKRKLEKEIQDRICVDTDLCTYISCNFVHLSGGDHISGITHFDYLSSTNISSTNNYLTNISSTNISSTNNYLTNISSTNISSTNNYLTNIYAEGISSNNLSVPCNTIEQKMVKNLTSDLYNISSDLSTVIRRNRNDVSLMDEFTWCSAEVVNIKEYLKHNITGKDIISTGFAYKINNKQEISSEFEDSITLDKNSYIVNYHSTKLSDTCISDFWIIHDYHDGLSTLSNTIEKLTYNISNDNNQLLSTITQENGKISVTFKPILSNYIENLSTYVQNEIKLSIDNISPTLNKSLKVNGLINKKEQVTGCLDIKQLLSVILSSTDSTIQNGSLIYVKNNLSDELFTTQEKDISVIGGDYILVHSFNDNSALNIDDLSVNENIIILEVGKQEYYNRCLKNNLRNELTTCLSTISSVNNESTYEACISSVVELINTLSSITTILL